MTNRLARATSPYLLQHKDNPVDWREWSEEAFAERASLGRFCDVSRHLTRLGDL